MVLDDASQTQTESWACTTSQKLDEYLTRRARNRATPFEARKRTTKLPVLPPRDQSKEHSGPRSTSIFASWGDMMVLAFQTESNQGFAPLCLPTRAAIEVTLKLEWQRAITTFSHHGGPRPRNSRKSVPSTPSIFSQLAYVLERLKNTKEGAGTLLDNCTIVYGGGISDGNGPQP